MPSMHDTSASRPVVHLPCTPCRPPDDLLAAIGTRRQLMRYPPGCCWWRGLDELPPGDQHHNPGPPPVLKAVRDGRSLTVWCKYCRTRHRHSAHNSFCDPAECACPLHTDRWARFCLCALGAGSGHRVAHCPDLGSPYRRTGYVIKEVAG